MSGMLATGRTDGGRCPRRGPGLLGRPILGLGAAMLLAVAACTDPVGADWPERDTSGAPCIGGWDCISGVCFAAADWDGSDTGWTDGMCVEACDALGACPDGLGCTAVDGQAWCVPSCDVAATCRDGYVCHPETALCLPDCRRGWDCGNGFECTTDGVCRLAVVELAPPGAPCDRDFDCASGICFPQQDAEGVLTGWTDGMCALACAGVSCPEGTDCTLVDDRPWCLPTCRDGADCREGYVCNPQPQVCLPDCRQGWDCGDDYACTDEGLCEMDWPELAPIGEPCVADADCDTGWCLAEVEDGTPSGWVDGTCSVPCGAGVCPPATGCAVLDGQGFCLPACTPIGGPGPGGAITTCRQGYVCDPDFRVCLPSCTNEGWDCGPQYVCRPDGVCGFPLPGGT